ncbi:ABC transporter permease subunit [Alcaligenaceae bacterium 429]|uniref:ABC transporter permease subunit n=1 Tax=Paenalcaligenes sp. Me52 TaxID=3392038 RepID=UPI0010922D6E|nr:ABC transporter permease subunit [Alcaligenaceae bacterium 429]
MNNRAATLSLSEPRPSKLRKNLRVWLPALPAIVFLGVFFLLPVLQILQGGFMSAEDEFSVKQFARLFETPVYVKVLWTTFGISVLTAVFSVVFGYPIALLLSSFNERRRNRWLLWIMLPFWTSYLVKTYAWMLLMSRSGVLTSVAEALGLIDGSASLMPSLSGVLVGMVHAMLPLAVLTMLPIMQGISRQLGQAAETLGAGRATGFLTIFLPLSMPGVAAAGLLVFITSLGFFIVPALLGTPRETMIAQLVISSVLELFDLKFAGALSTVLLLCSIVVFYVYDRMVGLTSLAGAEAKRSSKSGSGMMLKLLLFIGQRLDRFLPLASPASSSSNRALSGYTWLILLFLVLPVIIVVPIAFTKNAVVAFPPELFSLRWFKEFFNSSVWQAAVIRSFGIGLTTAFLAVVLGFGATFALTKLPSKWTKLLFGVFVAPLIVPRIVIAIGLLYLFASTGLVGTDLGMVIGHTVLALPYAVVTLSAGLRLFDWRLDDAARILGASVMARLRTVILPLLAGSLASAFLFAFIVSFDDLTIAIFVSGGINTTLPKQMWDDIQLAVTPTLAAVSTVLLIVVTAVISISSYFKNRRSGL